MNLNNQHQLQNATFSSETNIKSNQNWLSQNKEKKCTKELLAQFLVWLKEQIDSGNEQFSLDKQDLILYKLSDSDLGMLFILPEVFNQYYNQTGIAADIIISELKNISDVTFAYTTLKKEKIIEIFPCKKFF